MPWLPHHIKEFEKLKLDWHWHIVHGPSSNAGSTAWCKGNVPGLSTDGTSEYLDWLAKYGGVTVYEQDWWAGGKDEMVNRPIGERNWGKDESVLMQVDVDEFWKAEQLETIVETFEKGKVWQMMKFRCNYFLGPDIIVTGPGGWGDYDEEWLRAWRWKPGMMFDKHEWPILAGNKGSCLQKRYTDAIGLRFNHFSWVTVEQARFKESFYQYPAAEEFWTRLQQNKEWPVDLTKFFYWGINSGIMWSKADLWNNVYPTQKNPYHELWKLTSSKI